MLRQLKVASFITFYLGILSSIGLVSSFAVYEYMRPLTLRFETAVMFGTWWERTIAIAIVLSVMFHFAAMLTTFLEIRFLGGESTFRRIVLVMVVISFMSVCGDAGLLSDIGRESVEGWDVSSEWIMLYLTIIPQVIAHGLVLYSMYRIRRYLKREREVVQPSRDDTMFYALNYAGLLCGAVGLWITIMTYITRTSLSNLKIITVYYNAIILAPYLVLMTYWLFTKLRVQIEEWYDEKQMADSMKAGFFALLISLPVMAILYTVQYFSPGTPADVLWFPLQIHLVLVMFSGMTLFLKEN